jgi:hypothetical protein
VLHLVNLSTLSPQISGDIENMWEHSSIPQSIFESWCLIKHLDDLMYSICNIMTIYIGLCLQ